MFLFLARPLLILACLKVLPNAILDTTDDPHTLPDPNLVTPLKKKKDWRLTLARAVFAWSLTECTMLFVLLVLQATDVFSASTRAAHFQFSLYALLAILIVLVPQSITLLVFSPPSSISFRTLLLSFIPVLISLALLSHIPISTQTGATLLTRTLSRLIVVGTIILGLLSGFGAMTRAWAFLPSHNNNKKHEIVPTEEDIRATGASLQSVQADIAQKQDLLARREQDSPKPSVSGSSAAMGWIKRLGDNLRAGDDLRMEIKGLEALSYTLSQTLQIQRAKLAHSISSRTLRGRLSSLIGRIFAGYCIFRTFIAAYNVSFLSRFRQSEVQQQQQQMYYSDILTNVLVWLLVPSPPPPAAAAASPSLLTPELISSFTRHTSLLLIGFILLSSIGLVMRGVKRGLKITSKTLGTSVIILCLAYLMGTYLLSTLVQLRSSFPPPPLANPQNADDVTTTTTNLFTLIPPYELFAPLFESAFLLSALLTALVRWGSDRLSMVD